VSALSPARDRNNSPSFLPAALYHLGFSAELFPIYSDVKKRKRGKRDVSGLQGFVADAAKKQEGRNNSKIFLLQNAEKD